MPTSRRHRNPVILSLELLSGGEVVRGICDQHLDTDGDPTAGWTFMSGDVEVTVASGTITGRAFDLTLSSAFDDAQPLSGTYDSSTGELANTAGFAASSATLEVTSVDLVAGPSLLTAVLDTDGVTLTLTFDQVFEDGDGTGFTVMDGEAEAVISDAVVADDTVTLTLSAAILEDAAVTVSYDADVGDMRGTDYLLADITDFEVTNNSTQTVPVFVSATILADGVTLRIVFDQAVTAGTATTGLSRSTSSITSGAYAGVNLDLVVPLTLQGAGAGTISYDAGVGDLAGANGLIASFGPEAITNDSAQTE